MIQACFRLSSLTTTVTNWSLMITSKLRGPARFTGRNPSIATEHGESAAGGFYSMLMMLVIVQ